MSWLLCALNSHWPIKKKKKKLEVRNFFIGCLADKRFIERVAMALYINYPDNGVVLCGIALSGRVR